MTDGCKKNKKTELFQYFKCVFFCPQHIEKKKTINRKEVFSRGVSRGVKSCACLSSMSGHVWNDFYLRDGPEHCPAMSAAVGSAAVDAASLAP